MAKKETKPIEAEEIKEEVIEEEAVEETPTEETNVDAFVERTLKAINKMSKPAKAERLAHRLLRKARKK